MGPEESNIGRRDFLQMTGAGIVAASAGANATQAWLRTSRWTLGLQAALFPSRRRNSLRI
jgi:hypothetical protein